MPTPTPHQIAMDRDRLVPRALAAYFNSIAPGDPLPAIERTSIVEHHGLRYVLLVDRNGTEVAVYRVHNSGVLRRMVRPPREVALLAG